VNDAPVVCFNCHGTAFWWRPAGYICQGGAYSAPGFVCEQCHPKPGEGPEVITVPKGGESVSEPIITEAEAHELAIDLLKSLDCPAQILEALDIWWMMRKHEIVKMHNFVSGVVEGESAVKALPEPQP
jgi:hypothetical protein